MFTSKFFAPVLIAAVMSATSAYAAPRVEPNPKGGEVIDLTKQSDDVRTKSSSAGQTTGNDPFNELQAQASGSELRKRASGGVFFRVESQGLGDASKRIRSDGIAIGGNGKFSFYPEAREAEVTIQDCGLSGTLLMGFEKNHYESAIKEEATVTNGRFLAGAYCAFRVGSAYLDTSIQGGTDIASKWGVMGAVIAQSATLHIDPRVPRYSMSLLRSQMEISVSNSVRFGVRDFTEFRHQTEIVWNPLDSERVDVGFGPMLSVSTWREPIAIGNPQHDTAWGVSAGGVFQVRFFDQKKESSYGIRVVGSGGGEDGRIIGSFWYNL